MKKWSKQWTQFMRLRKEAWKKIQDFNRVWTRDLAITGAMLLKSWTAEQLPNFRHAQKPTFLTLTLPSRLLLLLSRLSSSWVMEQEFHWNFGFLQFSQACLTESCSFGYGFRNLFSFPCASWMPKSLVTVKIDNITSDTQDVDLHRWLLAAQNEWVNTWPETT